MEKQGSWFLLAKCAKNHLWKNDILSKDFKQVDDFLFYS